MPTGMVFIEGIGGVFFGMTLIYLSIKITAWVIEFSTGLKKGDAK